MQKGVGHVSLAASYVPCSESMDQVLTTSGKLFAQPSKNSQLEPVKVELTADRLVVSRHDMVYEDVQANQEVVEERELLLKRGEEGLGFSIQGGFDFKCPIKVYKVFPGSTAERCGLHEKDVIFEVNGTSMWGKTHGEAAHFISNAGNDVRLHVGQLTLRDIDDQQPIIDKWLKMVEIPLKMASVTRYQPGTANLRPDQIQVASKDGKSKVTLHCTEDTALFLTEYLTSIEARIGHLNKTEMEEYNAVLDKDDCDQVLLMGWVNEHLPSAANAKVWLRKFLVLRNFRLQIYNIPPGEISEWARPEKSYKLVEMSIQVIKPHSFAEQRANTIVITTGHGVNHIISFENQVHIREWTKQIYDSTVNAVLRLQRQQFLAEWKDQYVYFILDIERGFLICSRENLSHTLWMRPFSALKRSSDDGHSRLRLECLDPDAQIMEVQEIELEDLQAAICCTECFLAAKVATLDPHFASQMDFVA